MPSPLMLPFMQWARGLRFPTLFKITAAALVVNLLLPDPIPFVDEQVFGLGTLLLAIWKRRKDPPGKDPPALPDNSPR